MRSYGQNPNRPTPIKSRHVDRSNTSKRRRRNPDLGSLAPRGAATAASRFPPSLTTCHNSMVSLEQNHTPHRPASARPASLFKVPAPYYTNCGSHIASKALLSPCPQHLLPGGVSFKDTERFRPRKLRGLNHFQGDTRLSAKASAVTVTDVAICSRNRRARS